MDYQNDPGQSELRLQSSLKSRNSQNPFCHILETLNKNYEKNGIMCSFSYTA